MPEPTEVKPIRWWPFYTIVALVVVALVFIWVPEKSSRQTQQVMPTMGIGIIGFLLFCVWFFAFSRLKGKVRLQGLGILVGVFVVCVALFRVRGVDGDLIPKLEWRWSSVTAVSVQGSGKMAMDYPQFLGPERNAKLHGIVLKADWVQHPPKLLWRIPVGEAWSAFAVVGGVAVTQEQQGEYETVACYDLFTGTEKWRHKDQARYQNPMAGIGPRATPTLLDDRVYTLGATGILNCLDLETGNKIWSRDAVAEIGAEIQEWGMTSSPLVLEDKVIVSLGGRDHQSLVAYHKDTGANIWSSGSRPAGNSSPSLWSIAETDQVLIFNDKQVASHDPVSGKLLWKYPWPGSTQHVAQPVPIPGDRLFVSTGYGTRCELIQIGKDDHGKFSATRIWQNNRLKAKFANVVYKEGYIYGLDDGILVCLDVESGKRQWKRGRYGHGQMILVDDLLLIQTESGDVVLVDALPGEFKERARFPALDGHTWNNPTLAAPYLLVRNDKEAACYELAIKQVN